MNIRASVWIVALVPVCVFAQSGVVSKVGVAKNEFFDSYAIPNVNNQMSLASLLSNPAITKELNMEEEQKKSLVDAVRKANGSFNTVHVQLPAGVSLSSEEFEKLNEYAVLKRAERNAFLDEVLTPGQWARLKQLAYQTEVARVGLGEAFSTGQLGRDVEVYENQITHLRERAGEIETKAAAAITKILADAQAELIAELTLEQQERAKACLGTPFMFRENDVHPRFADREPRPN